VDGVEQAGQDALSVAAACPACRAPESEPIYELSKAPVTCASVFDTAADARAVPTGDVRLVCCRRCGLLYNAQFDPAAAEVGARYESDQGASPHFGAYARELAESWIERYGLRGKTIIEVGSGQGEFMAQLVDRGVGRAIGFDPLANPARSTNPRIELIAQRFPDDDVDVEAAALVSRHTLEHVADVAGFMAAIQRWCARDAGRVVLVEVPATERILGERAFWDVYYEHCNYFTARTLRGVFERAGFAVQRLDLTYGDQYLVIEATVPQTPSRDQPATSDPDSALRDALAFGAEARARVQRCTARLRQLGEQHGLPVIWQGASKTVGLLTAVGEPSPAAFAVDLSPARHDRYLPGSGLMVRAPAALAIARPHDVVLMNPVYETEVLAEIQKLSPGTRLTSINRLFAT